MSVSAETSPVATVRPFRGEFPEAALADLHRRIEGGHFAAWEQPALFFEEMRAAFRSLR